MNSNDRYDRKFWIMFALLMAAVLFVGAVVPDPDPRSKEAWPVFAE